MDSQSTQVRVGSHWLSTTVFGTGGPPVVIEPAFGGDAESWRAIAETLAVDTTVVTYDRAAYGSSSRALDARKPVDIARDLHGLLDALGVTRPVVLVGHSVGGVFVRAFAGLYPDEVAGLVLVDSSHEAQRAALQGALPWRQRLSDALMVPLIMVVPRKVRGGADRRSIMREHRAFRRLTAADRALAKGSLGDKPLFVLTRGHGNAPATEDWHRWHGLNADLAQLSLNSRHVIAERSGHYIHADDPALVISAVRDVLRSAQTRDRLAESPVIGDDLPATD
ncbi:alpha/beta fold hydrolase [Streptacidiphilus sp. EB103A]|uniref:alpha/beta fold hydrolase n=1 Tax=Streptacidiphilus sp. EB103A TaxID=3156275 RepID=UPI003511F753